MISFLSSALGRWLCAGVLALAVLIGCYAKGRMDEHKKFVAYKAEVQAIAQAQEEKTKQIEAKHRRINEETKNAFTTRLSGLRAYYGVRLNKGGSAVSEVSRAAGGIDGYSPDNLPDSIVLAGQCSETTLMLISLQDWASRINEAAQ